jgi:hypothetical protein
LPPLKIAVKVSNGKSNLRKKSCILRIPAIKSAPNFETICEFLICSTGKLQRN